MDTSVRGHGGPSGVLHRNVRYGRDGCSQRSLPAAGIRGHPTSSADGYCDAARSASPHPRVQPNVGGARLKELKSMLNQGLITQSQYQEESQKILNQLAE